MLRRLKGFFALFPVFKKVRSPTASAEMTRQVEISTLSAHQMAHAGVVAHTSSWTPAAYELEESAPWNSDVGGLPVLPVGRREQGDKVVCILMGPTAGNAAGYRGGAINTGIEDFLVLPAVPVVPFLPGPALRDGFSHVLGLRIVVPEALRRPSGQLLRQRQRSPLQTLRVSLPPAVAAAAISRRFIYSSIFLVSDDLPSTRFPDVPPSTHLSDVPTSTRAKGHTAVG